jgi:hydrogenase large subunit
MPQIPPVSELINRLAVQMRPAITPASVLVGIHTGGVWIAEALHAILGGKNPHPMLVVGGVPVAISVWPDHPQGNAAPGGQGGTALDVTGLARLRDIIRTMRDFVDQVYLPDTLAIAGFYKDWFRQGEGLGNFLTYGEFPAKGMDDPGTFLIPRGAIIGRDLSHVEPVDLQAEGEIEEYVSHSWYDYSVGRDQGLHPYRGETRLDYTGPTPPYRQLEVDKAYSWLKSPRWKGKAMEVGPLARVLMLHATGHARTRELVAMALAKLDLPIEALFSTLGRTAARALESKILADAMPGWFDTLMANIRAGDLDTFNDALWDPSTWPKEAKGVGFMEAPRGALGHWLVIQDGKIANYQAVVPSTWNAGPRDSQGQPGAYEASLQSTRLHDAQQPIEILRTIHSFDPCIACAVHVVSPESEDSFRVRVD